MLSRIGAEQRWIPRRPVLKTTHRTKNDLPFPAFIGLKRVRRVRGPDSDAF
jgi:hypothetical protein